MAKTKSFSRESVLKKAIPLFMRKGYADTSIQDLEQGTGVNKSGLYSEFESKENLYAACLDFFAESRSAKRVLLNEPLGWSNIEAFLSFIAEHEKSPENGCFLIYSMRDHNTLPSAIKSKNEAHLEEIRVLVEKNIKAERTKMKAETIASVVIRLFAGGALLQNIRDLEKTDRGQSVEVSMKMLRSL